MSGLTPQQEKWSDSVKFHASNRTDANFSAISFKYRTFVKTLLENLIDELQEPSSIITVHRGKHVLTADSREPKPQQPSSIAKGCYGNPCKQIQNHGQPFQSNL